MTKIRNLSSGLDLLSTQNRFTELKQRLLFVLIALLIFRIGSFIPIPGIDVSILNTLLEKQRGTLIEMFNMFSGGALNHASIFALGIMPYISASIIIQLLTVMNKKLSEIKKEGEIGRRKINKYIRYTTLILAIFQSIGIAIALPNMSGMHGLVLESGISFYFTAIISLVTGTILLMWLGEQITERGIGNGISVIVYAGIVAGLPPTVANTLEQARQGELNLILLILVSIIAFIVIFFVVFMERGQRRITVHYATRPYGRKFMLSTSQTNTHLPLKVNMAGVIPAIFASSVILFPATILSWFANGTSLKWLTNIVIYLQPGQFVYIIVYATAIIFFCFFYTALVFDPSETADNLKKSGAFIPGIRPGEQTAKYLDKIMVRLTLIGALYIAFICLIPEFLRYSIKVPFNFGGTSLLIVVVVVIDFMIQIQTIIMSKQYESVLRKAKLKGFNI
ncbi:MAG: preprotein translocase subunit SecY [Candidatus Dasytiphilus stammeri]